MHLEVLVFSPFGRSPGSTEEREFSEENCKNPANIREHAQ
jgi:hypothetical protein